MLTAATKAHNTYTRDASTGKGSDRHFLGLRAVLRPGESHPLLDDPLFAESQEWILSTSGLSAGDRFYGTGFGTVYPSGYGINCERGFSLSPASFLLCRFRLRSPRRVMLTNGIATDRSRADLAGNKVIKFGIESKHSEPSTSTAMFRDKLCEALREMRIVCEQGQPQDPASTSEAKL